MGNLLPLIDEDGEVRGLTKEDFARARPASEVLPEILGPELDFIQKQEVLSGDNPGIYSW